MLEKLSLHGYRGFDAYELGGFGRVNLVVGKNNCGKTTVLEAIELVGTMATRGCSSSPRSGARRTSGGHRARISFVRPA